MKGENSLLGGVSKFKCDLKSDGKFFGQQMMQFNFCSNSNCIKIILSLDQHWDLEFQKS